MKRIIALLSLTLCLSLLCGCAGTTVVYTDCTCDGVHETTAVTTATTEPVVTEGAVKTGLAVMASAKITDATAEEAGKLTYDVSLVAVLVDDEGVIVDCIIDSLGTEVTFDATGVITGGAAGEVLTKNELGFDYNMELYTNGAAVGEWFEQAAALAQFTKGKTVEEVFAAIDSETGLATDVDLATSATIKLGGYVAALEAAVQNAKHLGAQAGDELKLATINAVTDAAALNCDAVALTLKDGVITSCFIDSLQAEATINADGTAVAGNTKTKNQLGFDYNMELYTNGAAVGEWFEQAASFCAYVTGKTPAEVANIAIDESTVPTEVDLVTSVTIKIGGFQALIAKAAQ